MLWRANQDRTGRVPAMGVSGPPASQDSSSATARWPGSSWSVAAQAQVRQGRQRIWARFRAVAEERRGACLGGQGPSLVTRTG
jgi:hypothetical protein